MRTENQPPQDPATDANPENAPTTAGVDEVVADAEAHIGRPKFQTISVAKARTMFQGAGTPANDIEPTIRKVLDHLDGFVTVNGVPFRIDPTLDAEEGEPEVVEVEQAT